MMFASAHVPATPLTLTKGSGDRILPPKTEALAAAPFGESRFVGRLPVRMAGLCPRGHAA